MTILLRAFTAILFMLSLSLMSSLLQAQEIKNNNNNNKNKETQLQEKKTPENIGNKLQENKSQEIILWHSMDGALGEIFNEMVARFNARPENVQKNIKILPQYKGTYEQTLNTALKIINTKDAPHILQVYEMGNLVMQAHPGAYIPLNKLSSNPSPNLQPQRFLPGIREFYKARNSNNPNKESGSRSVPQATGMPSLPFSASSVILFYNKDAFKKAGLDPSQPPKTWEEFEKFAKILKEKGSQNVLAAGWLSGHHIDQMGAWHNQAVATKGNGVDGDQAILKVNQPFFQYHIGKLAEWFHDGIFSLETGPQAEKAFANGEVLILTQGANRLPNIEKHVAGRFEVGLGFFPYWQGKIDTFQNTVAGGGSFWAMAGHQPEEYQSIQSFFEFLADPKTQAEWHQKTCYMPVVLGAEAIADQSKFYTSGLKGKAAKIALDSFTLHPPKEYSRGILLPNFPRVREVMIQELKEAIRGNKNVEAALEEIDQLGNKLIQEKHPQAVK